MALGGIPVSGGATKHGTLMYCNLLYNPLLIDAYGNALARPAPTIGGTAGVAGYEAFYATDLDSLTLWKTAASAGAITYTIDLGVTTLTIYGIVVVTHNMTVANITSALLEGGTTNACSDVSESLVLNAATLTPAYCLLTSPVAKRYWQLKVTFAASTALQCGEIFLIGAAPLAFTDNYNKGLSDSYEYGMVKSDGLNGIPRIYTRWQRKAMELDFYHIPVTQLTAMQEAARNSHVIFSPEGADSCAYFGTWEIEKPKNMGHDLWNVTARFTESAR